MIVLDNLNLSLDQTIIANNLSLKVKSNQINTILMPNSSGKTTLAKSIQVNNKYLINTAINTNYDVTVLKYLGTKLPKTNENKDLILKYSRMVDLDLELLSKKIKVLDDYELLLIELIIINILKPSLIIIDNSLINLNNLQIKQIFKLIDQTVIYFTHNINNSIINKSAMYYIINNGTLIISGKSDILLDSKLFDDNNLILPFYLKLSGYLKLYKLIDDSYLTKEMLGESL